MSKIKRIVVSILVLLSCTSFVFASSVNMNLATGSQTVTNSETSDANSNNNVVTNEISNTNTLANNTIGNPSSNSNIAAEIQSVNNINDVGSSSIELNQILNIFLIAIGLILILLAIAILIRIKK